MMEDVTAAEYAANVADSEPIEKVEKEINELKTNSPTVKSAVTEFWTAFWQEIAKRYA